MLKIVVVLKWKQLHTPTLVITQLNFINKTALEKGLSLFLGVLNVLQIS
jgi:flagellar biosynthesis/type III secretory pathway chaperone